VDNTFTLLYDFKVRTGDNAVLPGSTPNDIIAVAKADVTGGGVVNVSANQSTANAILGITAAQYNAADAKFKTLYDTVTRASKADINNALEAVRPELHMAGVAAATRVTTQTTSLANTQLASLRDGSESGMYAGSASGGLRAWLQGFGQTADQSIRNGIAGYEADSYGVAVGFDTSDLAQNWVLGLMFAYGNSDIDSKSVNRTTTDIDSYQLGLYSSYNFDSATYLTGQLGYIWMSNDQLRRNVIPGVNAKGDFDSYSVYARLEAGRGYNVGGDAVVTPKFLVNYQHYNADRYTETLSGGAGLNVSADSINIFELGVGADVKWNLKQADGAVFQPKFSAGVRHDLIGDEFKTTNSFIAVPSASFTTRGADPAQTTYNLGAALTYFSAANWELSAAYDYEAKADFNSHTGSLKASFKF
jgi:outer membrane autotransporter protein